MVSLAKSKRDVSSGLKAECRFLSWHLAKQYIHWLWPNITFFLCLFFRSVITIKCLWWAYSHSHTVFSFQLSEWSPIHWKKDIFSTLTLFVQKLQIENYYRVRSTLLFLPLPPRNRLPESCATDGCFSHGVYGSRWVTANLWSSHSCLKGSFKPSFITISIFTVVSGVEIGSEITEEIINLLDLATSLLPRR